MWRVIYWYKTIIYFYCVILAPFYLYSRKKSDIYSILYTYCIEKSIHGIYNCLYYTSTIKIITGGDNTMERTVTLIVNAAVIVIIAGMLISHAKF